MPNIIVNATASRASGALIIFHQFLDNIVQDESNEYILFVDPSFQYSPQKERCTFIPIDTRKWFKRIIWDEWGLRKWLKKNEITPSLIVSFQNMGTGKFYGNTPELVYYHQILPLSNHSWSFFKKSERIYFLYKHIYPLFVARTLKSNTTVVVQLPCFKEAFLQKFKISKERVFVIPPNVSFECQETFKDTKINYDIHLIYPATPLPYKNHATLLSALQIVKERRKDLFHRIKLHFTFDAISAPNIVDTAQKRNIYDILVLEGTLQYARLLELYRSSHALLFPSFIESYGLPLLEAASMGLPIVASDLPFARDVLCGYEGVNYINYQNANEWADAIIAIGENGKKNFKPYKREETEGWPEFFKLINKVKLQ